MNELTFMLSKEAVDKLMADLKNATEEGVPKDDAPALIGALRDW